MAHSEVHFLATVVEHLELPTLVVVEHSEVASQVDTQVPVKRATVFAVVSVVVVAGQANTGPAQHTVTVVPVVELANHVLKFVTTAGHAIADSSRDNLVWSPADHAIFVETQYPYM